MDRRKFVKRLTVGSSAAAAAPLFNLPLITHGQTATLADIGDQHEFSADVVIAGGGLGGCAAALAALRNGLTVVLTEETDWIGGQLTQQGVPPDEHQWIETHGATQLYRDFRTAIREYYIRHYPLTESARSRQYLNPGDGAVSPLCHEPRVALAVLHNLFAPYISSRKFTLLLEHRVISADVTDDNVRALKALNQRNGVEILLSAPYYRRDRAGRSTSAHRHRICHRH